MLTRKKYQTYIAVKMSLGVGIWLGAHVVMLWYVNT